MISCTITGGYAQKGQMPNYTMQAGDILLYRLK